MDESAGSNDEILQKYKSRFNKWHEKTLNQHTFFNSLVLTYSIGFLAFIFKDEHRYSIAFSLNNIDWPLTIYQLSLFLIIISTCLGFIVVINKMMDYRITTRITFVRVKMFECLKVKLDGKLNETYSICERICLLLKCLFFYKYLKNEDFKSLKREEIEEINKKFKKMRDDSYNIGLNTWFITKLQTITFGLAILMYFVYRLIK